MTELSQYISSLPNGSWIPIAVLMLAGAASWAAGRRLLRTGFAGLGLLSGAAIGWILGETLPLGLPSWATAVAGALLLALVATMAYRAAVAVGLGVVLAGVAALGVCSAEGYRPAGLAGPAETETTTTEENEETESALLDEIDAWLDQIRDPDAAESEPEANGDDDAEAAPLEERLQEHLEQAKTLGRQIVAAAVATWNDLPETLRRRMLAAVLVAAALGFVLGTLASSFSGSLVTAFGGGLALLVGVWAGVCKLGFADAAWLPDGPRAWLTSWVLLTIIGLLIQWTGRPRRADKPA